jgi:hypothetical protein
MMLNYDLTSAQGVFPQTSPPLLKDTLTDCGNERGYIIYEAKIYTCWAATNYYAVYSSSKRIFQQSKHYGRTTRPFTIKHVSRII